MKTKRKMPTCQRCKKQWSWFDTIKGALTLSNRGMQCPYCKRSQYLTKKAKNRSNMSIFFIIAPLAFFYNISPLTGVLALAGAGLVYLAIWPFLVELTNEQN